MEMSAVRKKNTRPAALCVGDALKAFLARQVPTSGRRKTVAKTDSCGWAARCDIQPQPILYNSKSVGASTWEAR